MKQIKKLLKSIVLIGTFIYLSSCSGYLDVVPDNTMTLDDIFSVKAEAWYALATIYSYMPEEHMTHNTTWLLGDEYVGRLDYNDNSGFLRGNRIMRGLQSVNSPAIGSWSGNNGATKLYEGIRSTNTFIENIDKVRDMTSQEIRDWKAQAKFLKAYYMFLLVQKYGPIVIMDQNVSPDASQEELFLTRSKVEDCFNYILDLIDEALPDLKERHNSADYGQIDQIGASAIKARILLFRASPFYNGNRDYFGDFYDWDGQPFFPMETDKEKWKDVIDAVDDALALCYANGKDIYTYEKEIYLYDREDYGNNQQAMQTLYNLRMLVVDPWNKELLWGHSHINYSSDGGLAQATNIRLPAGYGEGGQVEVPEYSWNWLAATYAMAERYYTSNGLPITDDLTFDTSRMHNIVITPGAEEPEYQSLIGFMQPGAETINLYLNREPRFYANLGFTGSYWRGHMVRINTMMYQDTDGGLKGTVPTDYLPTGIGIQKFVHPESTSGNWTRQIRYPYPIIRIADLYLMRAEALNEYLDEPNNEVWDAINTVRSRAGIPNVELAWGNPAICSNVNKHRNKDGMRDIILHERSLELAFEGSHFWDMLRHKRAPAEFSKPIWGWDPTGYNAQTFFVLNVIQQRRFSITDCLWPIDLNEINTNANLIQNPGW